MPTGLFGGDQGSVQHGVGACRAVRQPGQHVARGQWVDLVVKLDPAAAVTGARAPARIGGRHGAPARPTPAGTRRPRIDGISNQPTDVTWDPQGNIFVSDAIEHGGAEVRQERCLDQTRGKGNGAERGRAPGRIHQPHGIAADAKGNIYVADRGNARIQVLDPI